MTRKYMIRFASANRSCEAHDGCGCGQVTHIVTCEQIRRANRFVFVLAALDEIALGSAVQMTIKEGQIQ